MAVTAFFIQLLRLAAVGVEATGQQGERLPMAAQEAVALGLM
jgi:hypothetical protein